MTPTSIEAFLDASEDWRSTRAAELEPSILQELAALRKNGLATRSDEEKAHRSAWTQARIESFQLPEMNGIPNPIDPSDPWGDGGGVEKDPEPATVDLADLAAWLSAQTWSPFALSLASQYRDRRNLSSKQIQAGVSMREKCEAKKASPQIPEMKGGESDPLDLSSLPSGHYSVPGGDTRLKVRVDNIDQGKWAGWIFVKDGAVYGEAKRYGSQRPGESYRGEISDQLRRIMEDPREAMAEYGRLTGTCGMCARRLEDEESVARGIGPICAGKW
jgi:hypothetical protein